MSMQEHSVHCDFPGNGTSSSSGINSGNEPYDPHNPDDDDDDVYEQSIDIKPQKQDSIRINNGTTINPVINNISSNSDKPPLLQINEQQQSSPVKSKSKSPIEQTHRRHSDRRSRSPNRNHHSSDRKRLRPSSPDPSTTVNNNELSKYRKSYHDDNDKKSKYSRSSSSSRSPSSSNHNKKYSDSKDDRYSNSSDSHRSSKRDDYHSQRYNSSRNYHSSSKSSSRDYSSSSSSHTDRRTTTINSSISSPSRIPSTIILADKNSPHHNNELKSHETSTEDRNRIYNRLKNVDDNNTPIILSINNNSNKNSSSGSAFTNTNGGSQRSRINLIQIVTTEPSSISTQIPLVNRLSNSQNHSESIKSLSTSSVSNKIETNDSSKSATIPKTNGTTADDMLMEEMLLEEEQEKIPFKSIDLDSLTIPDTSTQKVQKNEESIKPTPTTSVSITTTTITTTPTTTSTTTASSSTPSPTKKPYTLYKVPHTNHMTPPLSSRHKKQTKTDSLTTQSNSTSNKFSNNNDNNTQPTSLDKRISSLLGAPPPPASSIEPTLETRPNLSIQLTTTSTPSDKSTESPQDIKSLISTMTKKDRDHSSLTDKLHINEERRSSTSKHYTTEWIASQKPEEAPPSEEFTTLTPVTLPTLISSQPSINNTKVSTATTGDVAKLVELNEKMCKFIQTQGDTTKPTTTETEDAVPISAKHLEKLERRKQREKHQTEIAAIAKEALKPAFKKHTITKEEYKEIMKKVVTKATHANEVDRKRISKMIQAYVEKYRTIHQQKTSKPSTNSNTNGTT